MLGWTICRRVTGGVIKLMIVETEAYHQADPASHSYRGPTNRTAPMFLAGGHLYVYFTYGMHYALNIVTGKLGEGEGVLLRAAEPLEGIHLMIKHRRRNSLKDLARGPGRLAQALGVKDTKLSGRPLGPDTLYLEPPTLAVGPHNIVAAPRIGIRHAADLPWRFYIKDHPFTSR